MMESMMKIILKTIKPRAKQVNDILMTKRCERHADERHPSRAQTKQDTLKQVNRQFQEW